LYGKVIVRDRLDRSGTIFEVHLPAEVSVVQRQVNPGEARPV
jgi:hypothetical protein